MSNLPSRVVRRVHRTLSTSRVARANAAEALHEMSTVRRRRLSTADARRLAPVERKAP